MLIRHIRVRLDMRPVLLLRVVLAGLAALGMANESAAKVVHGMAHLEESRQLPHPAVRHQPGSVSDRAPEGKRAVESSDPEPGHSSLHATVVAPDVPWSAFIHVDTERVAVQPLVAVACRCLSDEELARPPGGASPPALPRAPPTA